MSKAIICIGTNFDREVNLVLCHELLLKSFDSIVFSEVSITTPYGNNYTSNFLNQLALIETEMSEEELSRILKSTEKMMGRTPEDKKTGVVKIDIDLIGWNGELLNTKEAERSYIKDLLPTLPR